MTMRRPAPRHLHRPVRLCPIVEGQRSRAITIRNCSWRFRDWEPFFQPTWTWTTTIPDPSVQLPEAPAHARHPPQRTGDRLPHFLHQRQIAGRRRADSRETRPARDDAPAQRQRYGEPPHRLARRINFQTATGRQSRAHAAAVDVLELGPGERFDAIVEMNRPGVWILGTHARTPCAKTAWACWSNIANQHERHAVAALPRTPWDYTIFGRPARQPKRPTNHRNADRKNPRRPGKLQPMDAQRQGLSARA